MTELDAVALNGNGGAAGLRRVLRPAVDAHNVLLGGEIAGLFNRRLRKDGHA